MSVEVTIIIPAYNGGRFIQETIQSATRQGLNSYEIIIGDDCSSDDTREKCQKMVQKYDNITYFRNESTLSEGANRNRCIARGSGEYIFPLDHDNILPDGLIAKLLQKAKDVYAEQNKHAMISPLVIQFFKDFSEQQTGLEFKALRWTYHNISYEDVLTCQKFCPSVSGHYLYHRSIYDTVGGYLEDVGSLDDLGYGIGTYAAGFRYLLLADTFYYHRIHSGSMWINEKKNLPQYWKNLFGHYGDYYTEGSLLKFKQQKLNLEDLENNHR